MLLLSLRVGFCSAPPVCAIVMEFCDFGSLYDVLHDGKPIEPSLLCRWAREIADGMTYLHSSDVRIVHRDLKSPKYAAQRTRRRFRAGPLSL